MEHAADLSPSTIRKNAHVQRARLEGLDLARFLAFVGMVIVNFSIVMSYGAPADWASPLILALEGRAAACFVVLAGIGFALMAQRNGNLWAVTLRRSLFLLGVGLLNMTIFEADILHFYAFYFLAGLALVRAPSAQLIAWIAGLLVGALGLVLFLDFDQGWDWAAPTYTDLWTLAGFTRHLLFNGWHPLVPWTGFFLFGMVLGRLDLGRRRIQIRLVLGGGGVLAWTEILSLFLTRHLQPLGGELAVLVQTAPLPAMPLYMIGGGAGGALLVGASLLVAPTISGTVWFRALARAGRQSLTLYIAHILLGMGVIVALGQAGDQPPARAFGFALIFCLLALGYAQIWAQIAKRGPLEMLMRKLAG